MEEAQHAGSHLFLVHVNMNYNVGLCFSVVTNLTLHFVVMQEEDVFYNGVCSFLFIEPVRASGQH